MKQRKRIYYSATLRAENWDRWRRGETKSSIGRRFDRKLSSVFSVLSPLRGIRPPCLMQWWYEEVAEGSPPPEG